MSSFPFYRQPDSMDCGPTCLQMITKYYGKNISLQTVRQKTEIGKEGVNMLGISQAAENMGYRTQAVKVSYDVLVQDALLPCILHWNQYHFVVLYKAGKRRLHIADPGTGFVAYTPEEFMPRWISGSDDQGTGEGIALLLEPTPKFYEPEDGDDAKFAQGLAFRNIFHYIAPYKKLIAQLAIGLIISSLFQLILPFLTQSVIDVGVNTSNINFVYVVLLAQTALIAGRLTVDFIKSWILLHISTRINISILTDFLIKLMRLPIAFFESKKTGDILQRMNDRQRIETFLTGSLINVLFSLANLLIFSVVLAVFSRYIFLVFLMASILYGCWVTLFFRRRKILDYKRFDISSREQSITIQMVQGMQEIKLNGVEKDMRWGWEKLQARLFKLNMQGLALTQWQQSGASFINEGKNILITLIAAKSVIDGHMTLGAMLAVQYIIGQLNSPIEQMIAFLQSWQNAKISIDRLNEVHKMEDEEPEDKQLLQELPASGSFQLFNMSFTYPGAGNLPVLKDINLEIPKGRTTAIVGMSGSGKTTLLKLLLRFYDPQQGDIRLGNTSLSHISHQVWRAHCGAVMQDSFIFSDSIEKNIAVGGAPTDPGRLRHAARIANVQSFIDSLPLGFNTRIGTEGIGISMGQKQRLLIARAVYRDPEFIFLDEATNSLDANNETAIIQNLASFLHGRTVVVVAHRLSTVKNADQIVVLNNGTIAELGTHEELVRLKGEYFTLVKNQLELGL